MSRRAAAGSVSPFPPIWPASAEASRKSRPLPNLNCCDPWQSTSAPRGQLVMSPDHQALAAMLTRLHLTAIRDQLDSLLDEAAKRELNLREAVAFLCEREVSRRDERRVEMATKIAHFPTLRDLDGFDFAAQPSIAFAAVQPAAAAF
jgi:hypothetical protein